MPRTLDDAAWLDGIDLLAWVGGEGARWLLGEAVATSGVSVAAEVGADACGFALGRAAAGARVALLASGVDAVTAMLPSLRQMRALGLRALVVVPSHGDEAGAVRPLRGDADIALAASAGCAVERLAPGGDVAAFLASASARARAHDGPLVAAFVFHDVASAPTV